MLRDRQDSHPELPVDADAIVPPPAHVQRSLLALVFLGGMAGAPLRYAIGLALPAGTDRFPWATFLVNVSGAFALGVLLEALARTGPDAGRRRAARLGLGTGLLGAFTTYSALAMEVTLLARADRTGLAIGYAGVSLVAGLVAAAAGIGAATGGHHLHRVRRT